MDMIESVDQTTSCLPLSISFLSVGVSVRQRHKSIERVKMCSHDMYDEVHSGALDLLRLHQCKSRSENTCQRKVSANVREHITLKHENVCVFRA